MMTKLTNHFNIPLLVCGFLVMFCGFSPTLRGNVDENTVFTVSETIMQVTGVVTGADDGLPLIGASVFVKGTTSGTVTDIDGKYSIDADKDALLVFSYTGYTTQEIPVNGIAQVNVVLSNDAALLDEVVVVGYGKQKKSHLTGSISKVTNETLDQIPTSRVDDALVGQVAGVTIQSSNPAAGEAPDIRIRGQGSISFDSNPLIVVDGIAVGTDADFLSSLDMNDIESIEVLKDAASSAIYGSRGANGIILITTKEGKEGPTTFSYNSYIGFKSVPENDVLITVDDWLAQARANLGEGEELSDKLKYVELIGQNTKWDEVMYDGGMIQSHAISAKGGTKNTKFRTSLSYLDDEGVLLTDSYQKVNFRLSLTTKIRKRITMGVTLNPSYTNQRRFPIGVHDAIRQQPWLPLYVDEDNIQYVNRFRENGRWADVQIGDYTMERMFDDYDLEAGMPSEGDGTDISATSNVNPIAKVLERERRKFQTKILANTYFKFKIADGLNFKQTIGGDFRYTRNTRWQGIEGSRNGAADSESTRSTTGQFHTVAESTLNYDKQIGKHEFSAVVGFAYEGWNRENSSIEAAGYDFDFIETIPAPNVVGAFTSQTEEALVSYLSRVNYAFDDKYLVSVSARRDGSSKFGPDNKFGFFPSASVGWRISEEAFLKENDFVEELKVRFSYGITGSNSGIGQYDYLGLLVPVGTAIGGSINTGLNPTNIPNSGLGWEKLVEINPGIDISLMRGRLAISLDYYKRTSEDLLLNLPVPAVTGFQSKLVNTGIVENSGVEFELRTKNISSRRLSWSTDFLVTHNKNVLVDFAGSNGLISIVDDKRPTEWIALEGQPISTFYGYVVKDEIAPEFIENPNFPINGQSQDIFVKDLNGDGVIDTDDRTVLGSPYPDLVWSVNNTFKIQAFDFSFMFQGSHGAEVRNISSQYIQNEFSSNQDTNTEFADTDLVVERIFTNDDIQDASYVALRNLNLGYTFPRSMLSKANIQKLRIYVSGQNLIYRMADGYVGYNPEGIDQGRGNPLTYGYQRGPAPIFRTFSVGVNFNF